MGICYELITTTEYYFKNIKGPFGNVVLATLFIFLKIHVGEKICGNTCNII